MLKFKLLALANFHQNGTKNWIWPKCDMPAVIVFRSKPKMNCQSHLFCLFFWFILCFVKWNETNLLLKDMKSREELFLLSLHIQRAMPETVATTKNEVNSARIELRPLMCSIFFSSLFCRLREDEERTNEAREPAWAITVGFGTTVTRLATPLNRLRQDSLYRQFLVGQTPVNTTEPRYVL